MKKDCIESILLRELVLSCENSQRQGIVFSLIEESYSKSSAEGESKELTMPSPMMVRVPDLVLMQPQKVFITDIFVLQDHKRAH